MYRIGRPFWKQLARMGVPLTIRVDVMRDDEAGVFVATSNDLRGMVCEATTMDELVVEVNAAVRSLLVFYIEEKFARQPVTDLRLCHV